MFDCTREALGGLDAHRRLVLLDIPTETDEQQLRRIVGYAFHADTAAYNRLDLCVSQAMHDGGLTWIREQVHKQLPQPE